VLAGLSYGVLSGLSLPPIGVWPLALAAIVPLAWAGCRGAVGPKRAAALVAIGTLPFWVVEHLWLWAVAPPGYPLLCLYLAAYAAVFVWAIGHARRADWPLPMALVVPFVWTALEVLRGEFIIGGYAWFLAGHPLIDSPFLAAPAGVFGAYAVSFLCAALAGAVVDAAGWSGIPRRIGGLGAAAILVLWLILGLIGSRGDAPTERTRCVRVAVVQTNVPQDNKMGWAIDDRLRSMAHFLEMTRQAAAQRPTPDLIAWPETMFPGIALNPEAAEQLRGKDKVYRNGVALTRFNDDLLNVQQELGIPMMVGCTAVEGDVLADLGVAGHPTHCRIYNSVVVVDRGLALPTRYDKVELTPFGEVIPFLWRWPDAQNWVVNLGAAGMQFELSPGVRASGLELSTPRPDLGSSSVRIATPVCFEATRADLCRRLVRGDGTPTGRSSLLINFSNDGWFGWWDPGRRQHLLAARWRCVELGLPMVRCVNTGVSCQIDPRGRIVTELLADKPGMNERTEGVLTAGVQIDPAHAPTPFERLGLIPAYLVMVVGLAGILVLWSRGRSVGV
jgi:apolipoprotein N-acyltransferase